MNLDSSTLQKVFNALDVENKGHITIEQFTNALEQFYNSSTSGTKNTIPGQPPLKRMQSLDVNNIVSALDPTNDGIVSFEDFKAAFQEFFDCHDSEELKHRTMNLRVGGKRVSICPEDFAMPNYGDTDHELKTDDSGFQEHGQFERPTVLSPSSKSSDIFQRSDIRRTWPTGKTSVSNSIHSTIDAPGSPYSETQSDLMYTDVDNHFEQIRRQMRDMEDKVDSMSSRNSAGAEGIASRLREENARLSASVAILEERLKEAEARYERDLASECSHFESILSRSKRTYESELETLRARLNKAETDYSEASLDLKKTKFELETSRAEAIRMSETLTESLDQISSLKTRVEQRSSQESRELKKALEEREDALNTLKQVTSATGGIHGRNSTVGNLGADAVARLDEMQQIIRRLKEENKQLVLKLKDAEEENWARSLATAQDLIAENSNLGMELDHLTKEEVVDLLTQERHANNELRAYLNRILEKVMQSHPELLESKK